MKKIHIYIITILIIIFDQLSKFIVISRIDYLKNIEVIKNFFSLTYVKNTGGAFSIFNDNVILLGIIGLFFFVFIIKYISSNVIKSNYEKLATSFVLGGLVGNMIDRFIRGGVVDFLDFKILNYDFPIFNIADIFIVIGVFIMMITGLGGRKDDSR